MTASRPRRPPRGPYGPEDLARDLSVSRETEARLAAFAALLARWQRRINLVGGRSLDDLWRRHMLDSAQLVRLLPGTRSGLPPTIADLGSGAGFPGLVLAILGAGHVHLIEADSRKCAFLREAARATAAPVTVHAGRIEATPPLGADIVTARACAPLDRLLGLAAPHLAPNGAALFLKGRHIEEELTRATKSWNICYELHQSLSSVEGRILRITEVRHV